MTKYWNCFAHNQANITRFIIQETHKAKEFAHTRPHALQTYTNTHESAHTHPWSQDIAVSRCGANIIKLNKLGCKLEFEVISNKMCDERTFSRAHCGARRRPRRRKSGSVLSRSSTPLTFLTRLPRRSWKALSPQKFVSSASPEAVPWKNKTSGGYPPASSWALHDV